MKLRITQKGFENYSGQMGMILFENGVSVYDVKERDALRLSSLIQCRWESGDVVTITKVEVEPSAPVGRVTQMAQTDGKPERVGGDDSESTRYYSNLKPTVQPVVTKRYTRAELEKIADESGINGLRKIAGPMNIRATSINKLIDDLLAVAGKEEELPEGVEVVEV